MRIDSATLTTPAALAAHNCQPMRGPDDGMDAAEAQRLLALVPGWSLAEGAHGITRTFTFPDYHHTMRFVNAVAQIAHAQDHHPDLSVHYDRCVVHYSTHDTGGLSVNDFICAAKVGALA